MHFHGCMNMMFSMDAFLKKVVSLILFHCMYAGTWKDYITALHTNESDNVIVRVSKCMDVLMELKHNFRTGLRKSVAAPSDPHSPANHAQDLKAVVKEVLAMDAFTAHPSQTGQCPSHHSTIRFHPLLHNVNEDKLQGWARKAGRKTMYDQWHQWWQRSCMCC